LLVLGESFTCLGGIGKLFLIKECDPVIFCLEGLVLLVKFLSFFLIVIVFDAVLFEFVLGGLEVGL
jgi:hypothetical protein